MSDLISRAEAIDRIHEGYDERLVVDEEGSIIANDVEDILRFMPSAKKSDYVRVIRCKDCKHAVKYSERKYLCYQDGGRVTTADDYCSKAKRKEE